MNFADLGPEAQEDALDFSDLGPGQDEVSPDASYSDLALQAAGAALDTPVPVVGGALIKAQEGLESASATADKFYTDLGVPGVGKAVHAGGRFVAGMIPARMKDALFVAMAGPALEGAAAVGRPIARAGGNLLADVAGAVAGKQPEVVKELFKRPGAMWRKAAEIFGHEHQKALVRSVDEGLASKGAKFREIEESLSGFVVGSAGKAPKVQMQAVLDDVQKEMLARGHHLPKNITGKAPSVKVGRIAPGTSEYGAIIEKLVLLKKNPKLNFGDALNLRRQLDDAINYGIEGSNGLQPISTEGQRILSLMRRRINTQLREAVPQNVRGDWDKANFAYSRAAKAYGELKRHVIGNQPRQTEAKLFQMLREGRYDDEVVRRVDRLGEATAKVFDELRDQLAAKEFQRWASGGIRSGMPFGLPTSPRLIGAGISGAGGASQLAQAAVRQVMGSPSAAALSLRGVQNIPNQPPPE